MAIQVHELSPDDFEALLKFSQSVPQPPQPPISAQALSEALHRYPGLSLVATQERQIVGAVLAGTGSARSHTLLLGSAADPAEIRRLLIDKAMMKLASRGSRTCHLGADEQPLEPFWDLVRWRDWPQLGPTARPADGPPSEAERPAA